MGFLWASNCCILYSAAYGRMWCLSSSRRITHFNKFFTKARCLMVRVLRNLNSRAAMWELSMTASVRVGCFSREVTEGCIGCWKSGYWGRETGGGIEVTESRWFSSGLGREGV